MLKILYLTALILLAGCSQEVPSDAVKDTSELNTLNQSMNEKVTNKIEATGKSGAVSEVSTSNTNKQHIIRDKQLGIVPELLSIPRTGVETKVEKVGLLENGQMGVPSDFLKVGWFEPGVMPGERGNAVIAGHVDSKTGPAVFFYLRKLEVGDEVIVTGQNGENLTFIVKGKTVYPKDAAPVTEIFGYSSRRMLNLITCTGLFDRNQGGHVDRLVIYTELMEE